MMGNLSPKDLAAIDIALAQELMGWDEGEIDEDGFTYQVWLDSHGKDMAGFGWSPTRDAEAAMEVRQRLTELKLGWTLRYNGCEIYSRIFASAYERIAWSEGQPNEHFATCLAVCERRDGEWHVRAEIAERVKEVRNV